MSRRPLGRWLFGKLPVLGDFVARGLNGQMRDALDHWLSADLAAARDRFGDEFEPRYDAAPPWRFVDCDPDGGWSGGALCASVDRAGRRFPLMLAAPATDAAAAAAVSGACLDALYEAFGRGLDADGLHAEPLGAGDEGWAPGAPEWALLGEEGPGLRMGGRYPAGIVARMLEMAA